MHIAPLPHDRLSPALYRAYILWLLNQGVNVVLYADDAALLLGRSAALDADTIRKAAARGCIEALYVNGSILIMASACVAVLMNGGFFNPGRFNNKAAARAISPGADNGQPRKKTA